MAVVVHVMAIGMK